MSGNDRDDAALAAFVRQHRAAVPEPPAGHEERLLQRLAQGQAASLVGAEGEAHAPAMRRGWSQRTPWFASAAAVVLAAVALYIARGGSAPSGDPTAEQLLADAFAGVEDTLASESVPDYLSVHEGYD